MSSVVVGTWVFIPDDSELSGELLGSGAAQFVCGSLPNGFEFQFESEALRAFLELGSKLLAEMDAQYAEEEAAEELAAVVEATDKPGSPGAVSTANDKFVRTNTDVVPRSA